MIKNLLNEHMKIEVHKLTKPKPIAYVFGTRCYILENNVFAHKPYIFKGTQKVLKWILSWWLNPKWQNALKILN